MKCPYLESKDNGWYCSLAKEPVSNSQKEGLCDNSSDWEGCPEIHNQEILTPTAAENLKNQGIAYIDNVGIIRCNLMEILASYCYKTNYEPLEMLYTRLGYYWLQNKASFSLPTKDPQEGSLASDVKSTLDYEMQRLDNHWGSISIDGGRVNISLSDFSDLLAQLSELTDISAYGMDPSISGAPDKYNRAVERELSQLQVGINELVREAEDSIYCMRDQVSSVFAEYSTKESSGEILSQSGIRWPGKS